MKQSTNQPGQGSFLDSGFCILRKVFRPTPTKWLFLWAFCFVFGPILIIPVKFGSYLGGTVMGAVLMIGFALMEGRS